MKKQRLKAVAMTTVLSASALIGSVAQADEKLNAILKVGQTKVQSGVKSQARVDKIADQTASLLQDFKTVNKQIEGLRVYNAQLEKQIASQLKVISELTNSIDQVTVMERQIQPLILRMLEGLQQMVALDSPFLKAEREERVQQLIAIQERSDVSVSEKFRQVLEAYKIESEYGRKIETYKDTLVIDDQEREVNVLMVGRVALVYQTTDTQKSGAYNRATGQWEAIDSGDYRAAILKGLKIAKKQATIDIMDLPILAPEAAQ
jgi:uncharacterized coiled-coil protein SlyX